MSASVQKSSLRFAACCLVFAVAACWWPNSRLAAQDTIYDEDSVKAAFLYHFSTFVAWPEAMPARQDFVIAVLGDDEIAHELSAYLPGRTIHDRPMRVRPIASIAELEDEPMLFIGAGRADTLEDDLEAVGNRPVLIVTDAPGALGKGSMINFKIVDRRIRFEIALRTTESAGLVLSSRLLAAAMFVDTTSAVMNLPSTAIVSNQIRAR